MSLACVNPWSALMSRFMFSACSYGIPSVLEIVCVMLTPPVAIDRFRNGTPFSMTEMFVRVEPMSMTMMLERSLPMSDRISANASVSSEIRSRPDFFASETYRDTRFFGAPVSRTRVAFLPPSPTVESMVLWSSDTSSSGTGMSFFACRVIASFNSFSETAGTVMIEEKTDEIGNAPIASFVVVFAFESIFRTNAAVMSMSSVNAFSSDSDGSSEYAYVTSRARPFSFCNSQILIPDWPTSNPM